MEGLGKWRKSRDQSGIHGHYGLGVKNEEIVKTNIIRYTSSHILTDTSMRMFIDLPRLLNTFPGLRSQRETGANLISPYDPCPCAMPPRGAPNPTHLPWSGSSFLPSPSRKDEHHPCSRLFALRQEMSDQVSRNGVFPPNLRHSPEFQAVSVSLLDVGRLLLLVLEHGIWLSPCRP